MNLRWFAFALLGLVIPSAHSQSSPTCVTHFYNTSNSTWSIYDADGRKSALFVAPLSTIRIAWGPTHAVTLHGTAGGKTFTQRYEVKQSGSCVVIQTPASSWPLSMNKPGNGDITTCAGGC